MADNEKIQKLQDELKSLKATLTKYDQLFRADGVIDSDEQKHLYAMQDVIKRAEAKLVTLSGKGKKKSKGPEKKLNSNLEVEIPALNLKIKPGAGGEVKLWKWEQDLHPKFSYSKSILVPGLSFLSIGPDVSLETKVKAELFATVDLTQKVYFGLKLGGNLETTGSFNIALGDTTGLLAFKTGMDLKATLNNKSFEFKNLVQKAEIEVSAIDITAAPTASICTGPSIDALLKVIGKDSITFIKVEGKKYNFLKVGGKVSFEKGKSKAEVQVGLGNGVTELQKDLKVAYSQALKFYDQLIDMTASVFEGLLDKNNNYAMQIYNWLNEKRKAANFEQNKALYIKACKIGAKQLIERRYKQATTKATKEKLAQDMTKLYSSQSEFTQFLKTAESLPIVKKLYNQLREGNVKDANDTLNKLKGSIEITMKDIKFEDVAPANGKNKYKDKKLTCKVNVNISDAQEIKITEMRLTLIGGGVHNLKVKELNDKYDKSTNGKFFPWEMEIDVDKFKSQMGNKKLTDVAWTLFATADFEGNFKDVRVYQKLDNMTIEQLNQ